MRTLRGKMLLGILVPTLLLVSVVAMVNYVVVSGSVSRIIENSAQKVVMKTSEVISQWIQRVASEVKILADTDAIVNALATGDLQTVVDGDLKRRAEERAYLQQFFLALPDGKGYTTLAKTTEVADRDYFKKIMGGEADLVISDAVISN